MEKKLTKKEMDKLKKVFSCDQIKMILDQFTVEQIRSVINHPTMYK